MTNPKYQELLNIPKVSKLKFMSDVEKFDAIKVSDQIMSTLADNYQSPIENVKTLEEYKTLVNSSKNFAQNEAIRVRDVLRNVGLLQDYVGRFDALPAGLDGPSNLHIRESIENSMFHAVTGLSVDASLHDGVGELNVNFGNTTAKLPFYIAYKGSEAESHDGSPVGIKIGPIQLSPDIQSKFPQLSAALNKINVADTPQPFGLVIEGDFNLQSREFDDKFFVNHLSRNTNVVKEIKDFMMKQERVKKHSIEAENSPLGLN